MINNKIELNKIILGEIIQLIKNKKFNNALELLKKISHSDQDNDVINKLRGFVYLNKKDWKTSLIFYQKISEKNLNFENLNNYGIVLFKNGKLLDAAEKFIKAINLKKDFILPYENLGILYKMIGNYSLSIKYTLIGLNIDPENIKLKNNLVDVLNYYKPGNINNKIIYINHKIIEQKTLKIDHNIINNINIKNILENSEKILKENNFKFNYSETQIFRRNESNLNCNRHLDIFKKFNIIPKFCFGCYKIQITLKNVVDLIKLYFYFNNLNLNENNIRKCLVEIRENIIGNYKGYIFCRSVNEANDINKIIKEDLKKNKIIAKQIEIKHGCTEYYEKNQLYKSLDEKITSKIYENEWSKIEQNYDKLYLIKENQKERIWNKTLNNFNLPDFLIIKNWLIYAKILDDYSYKNIFKYDVNTNLLSEFEKKIIKSRLKLNLVEN